MMTKPKKLSSFTIFENTPILTVNNYCKCIPTYSKKFMYDVF